MRTVIILTLSSVLASASAQAASLSGASGEVFVNAAKGFAAVAEDQAVDLKPGDKILVRENSFVTVSFKDCAVALSQPTVFTVTKKAPCTENTMLPDQSVIVSPTATTDDALAREAAFVGTAVSATIVIGAAAVLIDTLSEDDGVSGN